MESASLASGSGLVIAKVELEPLDEIFLRNPSLAQLLL